MKRNNISGILNINKPAGITSHDVVKRVRKIVGMRKVGHAGTLDPLATGVLLVCLGQATRLIDYLMAGQKLYRATILFGQTTNTYDAAGEMVAEADPSGLTQGVVCRSLSSFVGAIRQVPPVFSAIKKNGVPSYKLARKGIAVKLKPRTVQIDAIEPIAWNLPELVVDIHCQPGTYIRSLAHDVGQALEVGAHLTGLVRVASGDWRVEDAVSLEALAAAALDNALDRVLHPKEKAVATLPRLTLPAEETEAVRFGQAITHRSLPVGSSVAGYDKFGNLVAILQAKEAGKLQPKKVFIE